MILNIVEHSWETDQHLQEHYSRQVTFEASTINQLIQAVEKYVKELDNRATVSWEWILVVLVVIPVFGLRRY